ncbi:MAG: hypothetical protein J6N47_03680 [Lachnospiraceae bacterium]|nr:hypothetical protein [Lachnospiraceae bacterium]
MDFKDFCNKVKKSLEDYYGEEKEVEIRSVTKNNGVVLQGLTVRGKDSKLAPTIYLESFFEQYSSGRLFSGVIEEIISLAAVNKDHLFFDPEDFENFEKAKEHIVIKLVNTELNKLLLKEVPNFPFHDMSVVFFYLIEGGEGGNASILINNTHMETWKTDPDTLYKIALKNAPVMLPAKLHKMDSLMRNIFLEDIRRKFESGVLNCPAEYGSDDDSWMENLADEMLEMMKNGCESRIYVLTNREKYFGASCLLYDNVLKDCAEQTGGGFYILPSSVHELILVPDKMADDVESLSRMVREVNDTQVEDDEILGYSVYHYEPVDNLLQIC